MVADVEAVVVHLVEVDGSDEIGWADQFFLHFHGEVAAVEEAELAELEEEDDACGVIGGIWFDHEVVGFAIGSDGCAFLGRDSFAIGGDALQGEWCCGGVVFERDEIAGFEDDPLSDFGIAVGGAVDGPQFGVCTGIGGC